MVLDQTREETSSLHSLLDASDTDLLAASFASFSLYTVGMGAAKVGYLTEGNSGRE